MSKPPDYPTKPQPIEEYEAAEERRRINAYRTMIAETNRNARRKDWSYRVVGCLFAVAFVIIVIALVVLASNVILDWLETLWRF